MALIDHGNWNLSELFERKVLAEKQLTKLVDSFGLSFLLGMSWNVSLVVSSIDSEQKLSRISRQQMYSDLCNGGDLSKGLKRVGIKRD